MEASAQETREVAFIDGAKDIAFGSIAGIVSKVFEHPFDLCKVRLQSQVLDQTARFSGPIDCLTTTWRNEGIRGLYRGLPMPVIGAMAENATLFLTYGQLQRFYRWMSGYSSSTTSPTELAFAAAGAGAATSFLLTPIELIKCKMQVQMLAFESSSPDTTIKELNARPENVPHNATHQSSQKNPIHKLPGPVSLLRGVLAQHGVRGLWLGQTGTLIRETGGAVSWFGTKEAVSAFLLNHRSKQSGDGKQLTARDLYAWESALAGACAGVSYNVVLFPADSVKSALQTAEELRPRQATDPKLTFWGVARDMWRSQGYKGLYAGMGVTTARAIPSSAMIFLIYDGLSKRFG